MVATLSIDGSTGSSGDFLSNQTAACRRLVVAALLQGLEDHNENVTKLGADQAAMCEPGRWLASDRKTPFSYLWCCETLGLAPDRIRFTAYRPGFIREARQAMQLASKKAADGRRLQSSGKPQRARI